jgi:lipopolysaccharide transport system ATP-binding protein
LKTVSGILRPHRGNITVRGTVAPLIELGAGFDPELTARENIFLNGCVLGHPERFMRKAFDEIVAFSELENFLEEPLKNFSSGMRARLGFSVATVVKPDILIVDEILSVGDFAFRRKCETRMQQLLSGGTTLLYVSHSADEIRRMCRHALWLDRGEVRMQGSAAQVCGAYLDEQKKKG